ncbi:MULTISPECIES: helix-turn-helix domain-containing protein [unclassified Pseudomonas]|uniref:helix-turn-helix domain-containing protein n=1 Tax=unclassified Pseudomonas TaxID=196821 RepID=UPI002114A3DC|nr:MULTISPECIES: helix-turn-helix domain-containing protein [unclassified Pseudomonas]
MKVTLRFSAYIPSANNSSIAYAYGLHCAPHKPRATSQQACERSNPLWRTPHLAPWGSWINEQRGLAVAHPYVPEVASQITARKPYLLKTHPYSMGLTVIPTLKTTPTSPALASTAQYSDSPDTWLFCSVAQHLCNNTSCIPLTAIESLLIKTLTQKDERICSKQELIIGINKDTYSYSGLEMCLSRLQNKFKSVFGERLFRSVRNRGYCLVQDVQIAK